MTTKTKQDTKAKVVKKPAVKKAPVTKFVTPPPVASFSNEEKPKAKTAVKQAKPKVATKPAAKKPAAKVNTKSPLTKQEKIETAKITKIMNDNFEEGSPPGLTVISPNLTISKNVPVAGGPRPSLAGLFNSGVLSTYR